MASGKRMHRFLFTTGTSTGHVNPVLPIASALVERGHEVVWATGRADRAKVEATGARFHPYPDEGGWIVCDGKAIGARSPGSVADSIPVWDDIRLPA